MLERAFAFAFPAAACASALRVSDAFVVKYDASAGQRRLTPHRDGSVFSFNVALNHLEEYDGGGTFLRKLARAQTALSESLDGGCQLHGH